MLLVRMWDLGVEGTPWSSQPTSQAAAARISLHNGWKSGISLKKSLKRRRVELSHSPSHEQLMFLQQCRNSVLNVRESSVKWEMPKDNAQNAFFLKIILIFLFWNFSWDVYCDKTLKESKAAPPKKTPSTEFSLLTSTNTPKPRTEESSLGFTGATTKFAA